MKTEEKEIQGKIVSMTTLGFLEKMELKRSLLAPVFKALSKVVGGGLDSELDLSGVEDIISYLDEKTFRSLIIKVLERCTIEGKDMSLRANWDDALEETTMFYEIVRFFVEVNYGDFLDVIRGGLERYGVTLESVKSQFAGSYQTTPPNTAKSLRGGDL